MSKLPILLIFIMSSLVYGQEKITLGFQGGINLSSIRGFSQEDTFSRAIAIRGGIHGEYHFSSNFSAVINVSYDKKGVERKIIAFDPSQGGFAEFTTRINHNYIGVPVMFRYTLGKENKVRYFANVGPYVGFLLKVKNGEFDLGTEGFKKVEYGLSGGVGVIIPLSERYNLYFELRDNLGLTNISDVPIDGGSGEIKTNTYAAIIGFLIDL